MPETTTTGKSEAEILHSKRCKIDATERHQASRGLSATAELLVTSFPAPRRRLCDQCWLSFCYSLVLSVSRITAKVISRFHSMKLGIVIEPTNWKN